MVASSTKAGPSVAASTAEPPPAASWPGLPPGPGLDVGLQVPLWGDPVVNEQTRPLAQSERTSQRSPSPWLHPAQNPRVPAKAQARLIARKLDCMGPWVSTAARVCEGRKSRPHASVGPWHVVQS
jgi:hypothetical protein